MYVNDDDFASREAYRLLEAEKRDDESFSDVVIRLTSLATTEVEIAELAGGLGAEFATEVEGSSAGVREALTPDSD